MAWVTITRGSNSSSIGWEYDNSPTDPGANSPERNLWLKQTNGIRQFKNGHKVYTKTRKIGSSVATSGEISKTYWDNK